MKRIKRIRSYQMKRWFWGQKTSGFEIWSEREKFGEVKRQKLSREIREKWTKIALSVYIDIFVAQWISRCWEVSRIKICQKELSSNYREAIERCPQQKGLDGSRSSQASIEHIETSSMDREAIEFESRWIKIAITAIEKRSSKGSIDSLAVEKLLRFEIA